MSRIPIFVSCPTVLNEEQQRKRDKVVELLNDLNMEARALGRSDYPIDNPLKEIYVLAKHCAGGIILGFEQMYVELGRIKRGTLREEKIYQPLSMPTPWNHIEAGILFGLKLPLLIFKENNVTGGIFEAGASDLYIHVFPKREISIDKVGEMKLVFQKWSGAVYKKYYDY